MLLRFFCGCTVLRSYDFAVQNYAKTRTKKRNPTENLYFRKISFYIFSLEASALSISISH